MKQIKVKYLLKRIPFLTMILFLSSPCYAQYQEKHEISFVANGGYNTLKYDLTAGKQELGPGGGAGLGYTFFFGNFFGIGTGIEMGYYNAKFSTPSFSDKYITYDGEENFEFRYNVNNYTEKQSTFSVNIPLMFQFQLPLFHDEHLCYLALGGRVGFPFNSRYKSSGESFKTSGAYDNYGIVIESPKSQGFGTFSNQKYDNDIKFHTMYILSAEAGMKWMTSDNFSLYTGIYLDYGINNIAQKESKYFLNYSPDAPASFPNESILNSRFTPQNEIPVSFTNKVIPAAIGLKIRLAFRFSEPRGCCP
ncbi:hypothetical protein FACS189426_02060 [Bacteroidia bacterium]|nr:hypothetical protein FACS189426_02060 [Bacteroidia bacterium]